MMLIIELCALLGETENVMTFASEKKFTEIFSETRKKFHGMSSAKAVRRFRVHDVCGVLYVI